MRILLFELKKILKNRLLIPLLLLFMAVSFLLFYEGPGVTGAQQRRNVINYLKKDYSFWNSLSEKEQTDFRNAMIEKYGQDIFTFSVIPNAEAFSLPGYFGDKISDEQINYVVRTLDAENSEIREMLEDVTEAAKFLGRQAVRSGDDYQIRRNLRIIPLYQERMDLTGEVRNWNRFLFTPYPALISLLLVLFTVSGLFSGEKDRRTDILLRTAAEGRGRTTVSKYIAAMIISAGIYLLIRGISLLSVHLNYGLMGAEQPVWGIRELLNCPYRFTTGQYALVSCGCELAAVLLLSVLFTAVSAFSRNSMISYLVNTLILFGLAALSFLSPQAELLRGPLTLLAPLRYFETYYTADILHYPVPWLTVQIVIWGFLSGGLAFLGGYMHNRVRKRL